MKMKSFLIPIRAGVAFLPAVLAVSLAPSMHSFAEETADEEMSVIAREIAVQRACQAALWMMPAVDTWDFAQGTINFGGKVGDVVQLGQPMTSVHGFLTANDVTPYTIASLTTADGPLVVDVPPATDKLSNFGTFVDAWMVPVADVGEAGTDKGKGGKYLFLPAGYEGDVPDEGYFVYQLESYSVSFAFRPVHRGDGTLEETVKYMRENLRVYPLAEADNLRKACGKNMNAAQPVMLVRYHDLGGT